VNAELQAAVTDRTNLPTTTTNNHNCYYL